MGDGQATRRRILDAATTEFASYGIAGARVDRIAANAKANKAQLYAYYGNKDALFDAVLAEHVTANLDLVPLTPEDLPGYAVRLYDAYVAQPELVRLATWARLERTPTGDLFADWQGHDKEKLAAIEAAQRSGHIVADLSPLDVHSMAIALSATWAAASITHAADRSDDDAVHERRRQALAATVRRAFSP
ncbi:transcriptional regulator, TetR family [Kribbella flavida DSM 17836]|uniref:Transcriptional regulator, TetR family n=1 Tax=Kribbella flavida (strain DSM 17836 / JCM 10339 / NBRC 14399) TaxID=479435 RepID=D2PRP2_KRIFD|nr:TetR family transcriptional regulator [Kribbella flavida]ADB34960.1 transcriptional regulator, TetR family [Kribbella flavida DSM 17836]